MAKILLITVQERNKDTGKIETLVSHGINTETGRTVITSNEPPRQMGAYFDRDAGEWMIDEPDRRAVLA